MPDTPPPRIALISATTAAIPPAEAALRAEFPDAVLWNIVDDRLLQDAEAHGGITDDLAARLVRLIDHAGQEGADGVLVTCSIYGGVVDARHDGIELPALSADSAAFADALEGGHRRILLLSSGAAPLQDSLERLEAARAARGAEVEIVSAVVPDAFTAARSGDVDALTRVLAAEVARHAGVDAVLLGQYSLAPAAGALAEATGLDVIAGPQRAARALQALLAGEVRS